MMFGRQDKGWRETDWVTQGELATKRRVAGRIRGGAKQTGWREEVCVELATKKGALGAREKCDEKKGGRCVKMGMCDESSGYA